MILACLHLLLTHTKPTRPARISHVTEGSSLYLLLRLHGAELCDLTYQLEKKTNKKKTWGFCCLLVNYSPILLSKKNVLLLIFITEIDTKPSSKPNRPMGRETGNRGRGECKY